MNNQVVFGFTQNKVPLVAERKNECSLGSLTVSGSPRFALAHIDKHETSVSPKLVFIDNGPKTARYKSKDKELMCCILFAVRSLVFLKLIKDTWNGEM